MDAVAAARGARTEEEILSRSGIPLTLGGSEIRIRPRTIRTERAWRDAVKAALGAKFAALDGLEDLDDFYAYLADSTDDLLALVLAYDETGTLDRDWVETHASSHEVLGAFLVLLEQTFPFFEIGRTFLPAETRQPILTRLIGAAIASGLARSTSEPSPPGGSAPRRSSRKR